MSTCNFHKRNAKHYYAVETEDEFAYDDLCVNVRADINCHDRGFVFTDRDDWSQHSLSSYDGKIISTITYYCPETEASLNLDVIVRSGYYSGVNLDWELNCEGGGYAGNIEDAMEEYERFLNVYYPEFKQEKIEKLKAHMLEKANQMIETIEMIFKRNSTPLNLKAVFSNGEGIYEEAEKIEAPTT